MSEGGALNREAFGLPSFQSERVELAGRGGFVIVREMTAGDALAFHDAASANFGGESPALWLVHRCAVDEAGARLFKSPADAGDCLTREEFKAVNNAVLRVNGMGDEAEKKSDPHTGDA